MGRSAYKSSDLSVLMAASEASIQQQRIVKVFAAHKARRKLCAATAKWFVGNSAFLLAGRRA